MTQIRLLADLNAAGPTFQPWSHRAGALLDLTPGLASHLVEASLAEYTDEPRAAAVVASERAVAKRPRARKE